MCHCVHYTEHKSCLVNSRETNEICPHSGIITRGSSREKGNLVRKEKRNTNFKGNGEKKNLRTMYMNIVFKEGFLLTRLITYFAHLRKSLCS